MTLYKLQQQFAHLSQTSFALRGDTIGIIVDNAAAHAEILVRGAHLLTYIPHGHKPVIWNSDASVYDEHVTLHSGMPIITPWFSDPMRNDEKVKASLTEEGMRVAHGCVRNVPWKIEDITEVSDAVTRITLSYDYIPPAQPLWKKPFRAVVTFTIGTSLDVTLQIHNTGDKDFTCANALHTYFALSDVEDVVVPSFAGKKYVDTLDNWQEKVWYGDMAINAEHDFIFLDAPQEQRIVDYGWHREVVITSRGSKSAVVWNPWKEKAQSLSGFLPEDYKRMICIETGQVYTDTRTIQAGKSISLGVTICTKRRGV